MSDSVKQIIQDLREDATKDEISETQMRDYAGRILTVYRESNYNVRSEIAESAYLINDPQTLDCVLELLNGTKGLVSKNEGWDHDKIHAIGYFIDHLALERQRLIQYMSIQTFLSDAIAKESSINSHLEEFEKRMVGIQEKTRLDIKESKRKIKRTLRSIDMHQVSVLGVFSAVVFAFTGGFTLLGSALSGVQGIGFASSFLLISAIALIGIVLFDCIAALLYAIAKYLEIEINSLFIQKCLLILNGFLCILVFFGLFMYWFYAEDGVHSGAFFDGIYQFFNPPLVKHPV